MESEPVKVPVVCGVKLTLITQLAPGATFGIQTSLSLKGGLIVIPEILRDALPEFVSVTDPNWLVWLLKLMVGVDRVTFGLEVTPLNVPPPQALSASEQPIASIVNNTRPRLNLLMVGQAKRVLFMPILRQRGTIALASYLLL
jgi:hypothetical protein